MLANPARRRYPYSVIPGGAYAAVELIAAQEADQVVARHYREFQRGSLRTVPSPFRQPVFVSYRRGENIFWTRRPVYLRQGETLLTDGTLYARARCGNRISETPQEPVDDAEPAPERFEWPEEPEPKEEIAEFTRPFLPVPQPPPPDSGEAMRDDGPRPAAVLPAVTPRTPPRPLIGGGANLSSTKAPPPGSPAAGEQALEPAFTPEPAPFLLMLTGILLLAIRRLWSRRISNRVACPAEN